MTDTDTTPVLTRWLADEIAQRNERVVWTFETPRYRLELIVWTSGSDRYATANVYDRSDGWLLGYISHQLSPYRRPIDERRNLVLIAIARARRDYVPKLLA